MAGSFPSAVKGFQAAKARAPQSIEACAKHMGTFTTDPSDAPVATKKKTPEERSQWPAQPKP